MTGLLDHLVGIAQGEATTVLPRPRSRFAEAERGIDIEWLEPDSEARADASLAPRTVPMAPQAGLEGASPDLTDVPARRAASPTVADLDAGNRPDSAPRQSPALSAVPPLMPPRPLARPLAVSDEVRRAVPQDAPRAFPEERLLDLRRAAPAAGEAATIVAAWEGRGDDATADGPHPLAVSAPALLPLKSAGEEPRDPPPGAPQIRIGRIEVRPPRPAVAAAAPTKPAARSRAAPRQTLDDFLARKRR